MKTITYKFVDYIPDKLSDDVLYISLEYRTAVHRCFCGCGNEVITPFAPTDWEFTFNGVSVSLYPSIGNWNFNCKSHYYITKNEIKWMPKWTDDEIEKGRLNNLKNKENYFKIFNQKSDNQIQQKRLTIWNKIKWFLG